MRPASRRRRVLMFHRFAELAAGRAERLVASTNATYEETGALTYLVGVAYRGYLHDPTTGRYDVASTPVAHSWSISTAMA